MLNSWLRIETFTSQPIRVKDTELRLRSQAVQLRLPVVSGLLLWNRPVAALVRTPDGRDQTRPVLDLTGMAILALVTLCLASTFFVLLFRRKPA